MLTLDRSLKVGSTGAQRVDPRRASASENILIRENARISDSSAGTWRCSSNRDYKILNTFPDRMLAKYPRCVGYLPAMRTFPAQEHKDRSKPGISAAYHGKRLGLIRSRSSGGKGGHRLRLLQDLRLRSQMVLGSLFCTLARVLLVQTPCLSCCL